MELAPTIAIVAVCVILEGFFSGTEIALISINRYRLSSLIEKGNRAAKLLEQKLKSPARLYGTTSLGTNIFVVAGTAVMTAYFAGFSPDEADLWAMLVMSPITLLLGEIIPKAFFQKWSNTVSYVAIYPLSMAEKLFSPVLWILSGISKTILRLVGAYGRYDINAITHDEIRKLFTMSEGQLDLHPEEEKMIHRILAFRDITVEQCMVPLIHVAAVEKNTSIEVLREKFREGGFSRMPMYKERMYNVAGIISAFDVLKQGKEMKTAQDLARPAFFVYRKKKIGNLLPEMQRAGVQMAVVVNEYSAVIGIVTREDLLEEIFGEIEDEYDETLHLVEKVGKNRWLVHAGVEIDWLNDQYGWNLPTGDYETMAGLVLTKLQRIPLEGEKVQTGDFVITIKEATERGVKRVEILKEQARGAQ